MTRPQRSLHRLAAIALFLVIVALSFAGLGENARLNSIRAIDGQIAIGEP